MGDFQKIMMTCCNEIAANLRVAQKPSKTPIWAGKNSNVITMSKMAIHTNPHWYMKLIE